MQIGACSSGQMVSGFPSGQMTTHAQVGGGQIQIGAGISGQMAPGFSSGQLPTHAQFGGDQMQIGTSLSGQMSSGFPSDHMLLHAQVGGCQMQVAAGPCGQMASEFPSGHIPAHAQVGGDQIQLGFDIAQIASCPEGSGQPQTDQEISHSQLAASLSGQARSTFLPTGTTDSIRHDPGMSDISHDGAGFIGQKRPMSDNAAVSDQKRPAGMSAAAQALLAETARQIALANGTVSKQNSWQSDPRNSVQSSTEQVLS